MSTPNDFATAAQALAASLLAATTDPADALRMLSSLSDFTPDAIPDSSVIGQAMSTMQSATGDLFRRAAVVAVVRASAAYQPSSYDDAAAVRVAVCALLDKEITVAADQGEDATFGALRTLRTAVVQDLTARGANLAIVASVSSNQPVPSLVLAQRLYRDSSRSDELVNRGNPRHPAFMPISINALVK